MNDKCPHCKARSGFDWKWSHNFDNTGYQTCRGCGKKIEEKDYD